MTFCVGVRVTEGLVALADTQIVRGGEVSSKASCPCTATTIVTCS